MQTLINLSFGSADNLVTEYLDMWGGNVQIIKGSKFPAGIVVSTHCITGLVLLNNA